MKALVLLSGGQDSSTCLFWSLKTADQTEALFLNYDQRHKIEWDCAQKICSDNGIKLHRLDVPAFRQIGGSAMIEEKSIETEESGLPNTFVPGRNIVFLTLAASLIYRWKFNTLIIGVNESDYSGYPDCRYDFIQSMERTLNLGLDYSIKIEAPLQKLSKKQIWSLAEELNCLETIIHDTHTCYVGDHVTFHSWGYGCGTCPACLLRKKGFEAFKGQKI